MTLAAEVGSRTRTPSRALYLPTVLIAAATATLVWFAVETLGHAGVLGHALSSGRAELVAPAVVGLVALVLACERLWPAERRPALARGHVHDAAYFALHVLFFVPLMTLLGVAFAVLLVDHARWLEVGWTAAWPRPVLLVVTIVLMDGANWLAHFADHRFSALWRLHALHHSQEELNVLTSFRAHPLSHLLGFFLATIPVVVLVGDKGMAPELITAYICLGTLPHANVNWSFGPIGKLVVSPAYHRIHHSYEGSAGINLAIVLTVWDVLAGRARFPVKGAAPCATGLAGRPVPAEQDSGGRWHLGLLARQLAEPFAPRSA